MMTGRELRAIYAEADRINALGHSEKSDELYDSAYDGLVSASRAPCRSEDDAMAALGLAIEIGGAALAGVLGVLVGGDRLGLLIAVRGALKAIAPDDDPVLQALLMNAVGYLAKPRLVATAPRV